MAGSEERFKAGDWVRCVSNIGATDLLTEGAKYQVEHVTGSIIYLVGGAGVDFHPYNFVLTSAPTPDVKAGSEERFKAGDWVRCVDASYSGHRLKEGCIYKVSGITGDLLRLVNLPGDGFYEYRFVLASDPAVAPAPYAAPADTYATLAREIGELVDAKQKAYGDSFGKSGDVLRTLYPDGVKPEQYGDLLTITRILDKLFRVATDKDALGESPYKDIAGYALLALGRGGGSGVSK